MIDENAPTSGPWYRHPWMWLVVGLPLLSVVSSLFFVYLAVVNRDDLVRDDWYKAGRSINQDVDADLHAQQFGLTGQLVLHPADLSISVELQATGSVVLPEKLQLIMVHSTIANEDMTTILTRSTDGLWHGTLPRLPMGKRHLQLEPFMSAEDKHRWRLRATDVIFQGVPVPLRPEI